MLANIAQAEILPFSRLNEDEVYVKIIVSEDQREGTFFSQVGQYAGFISPRCSTLVPFPQTIMFASQSAEIAYRNRRHRTELRHGQQLFSRKLPLPPCGE